jgi:hypothetical protein
MDRLGEPKKSAAHGGSEEYHSAMSLRPHTPFPCLLAALLGSWLLACSGSESVSTPPATTTTALGGSGGSTSTGGLGGGGAPGGAGGAGGAAGCPVAPACDAAPPDPGAEQAWNNSGSELLSNGGASHRGRDLFLAPTDPQWVLGKFAYGLLAAELALPGEAVDIYLDRDCAGSWVKLGSVPTSSAGANPTVEGVVDNGGRVYFQIPEADRLGVGRHRIHMVVMGDLTTADQIIEVIEPGTSVFVSDMDGTLTVSDTETWTSLITGGLPENWPSSPEALGILASKGLRPFYLTARPESLDAVSHEFLSGKAYPPGILHTTLQPLGATGAAATTYKTDELAALVAKGAVVAWSFGNSDTDAQAYENTNIQPVEQRIYIGIESPPGGGRVIQGYDELLAELEALPPSCAP